MVAVRSSAASSAGPAVAETEMLALSNAIPMKFVTFSFILM